MTAYGTSVGYVPLREWIAEHHGVAPEQVLVTNGSMQADAFLFDALVAAGRHGDRSSCPPTTARCCRCATAAPTCGWSSSSPTGSTSTALERVLAAGAEPKLAHIIPNFQNPAGYTLSGPKRERLIELARAHGFTIFEDDPVRDAALLRRDAADDALDRRPTWSSTPRRSPRPSARASASAIWSGPSRADRQDRQDRDQHLHLAQHGGPGDRQPVLPLGARSTARSRPCATRCASAPRRSATPSPSTCPTPRFVAPEGGYFLWVDMPDGTDVAALFDAAAAAGSSSSRAPTSCSRAASRRCAWPTPGVTPRRSRRASSAWPRRTRRSAGQVNAAVTS